MMQARVSAAVMQALLHAGSRPGLGLALQALPAAATAGTLRRMCAAAGDTKAPGSGAAPPRPQNLHLGEGEESREVVEERKRRALQSYVDSHLGGGPDEPLAPDRSALAALLAAHGCVVRGGPGEARALVEALLAWKQGTWKAPAP